MVEVDPSASSEGAPPLFINHFTSGEMGTHPLPLTNMVNFPPPADGSHVRVPGVSLRAIPRKANRNLVSIQVATEFAYHDSSTDFAIPPKTSNPPVLQRELPINVSLPSVSSVIPKVTTSALPPRVEFEPPPPPPQVLPTAALPTVEGEPQQDKSDSDLILGPPNVSPTFSVASTASSSGSSRGKRKAKKGPSKVKIPKIPATSVQSTLSPSKPKEGELEEQTSTTEEDTVQQTTTETVGLERRVTRSQRARLGDVGMLPPPPPPVRRIRVLKKRMNAVQAVNSSEQPLPPPLLEQVQIPNTSSDITLKDPNDTDKDSSKITSTEITLEEKHDGMDTDSGGVINTVIILQEKNDNTDTDSREIINTKIILQGKHDDTDTESKGVVINKEIILREKNDNTETGSKEVIDTKITLQEKHDDIGTDSSGVIIKEVILQEKHNDADTDSRGVINTEITVQEKDDDTYTHSRNITPPLFDLATPNSLISPAKCEDIRATLTALSSTVVIEEQTEIKNDDGLDISNTSTLLAPTPSRPNGALPSTILEEARDESNAMDYEDDDNDEEMNTSIQLHFQEDSSTQNVDGAETTSCLDETTNNQSDSDSANDNDKTKLIQTEDELTTTTSPEVSLNSTYSVTTSQEEDEGNQTGGALVDETIPIYDMISNDSDEEEVIPESQPTLSRILTYFTTDNDHSYAYATDTDQDENVSDDGIVIGAEVEVYTTPYLSPQMQPLPHSRWSDLDETPRRDANNVAPSAGQRPRVIFAEVSDEVGSGEDEEILSPPIPNLDMEEMSDSTPPTTAINESPPFLPEQLETANQIRNLEVQMKPVSSSANTSRSNQAFDFVSSEEFDPASVKRTHQSSLAGLRGILKRRSRNEADYNDNNPSKKVKFTTEPVSINLISDYESDFLSSSSSSPTNEQEEQTPIQDQMRLPFQERKATPKKSARPHRSNYLQKKRLIHDSPFYRAENNGPSRVYRSVRAAHTTTSPIQNNTKEATPEPSTSSSSITSGNNKIEISVGQTEEKQKKSKIIPFPAVSISPISPLTSPDNQEGDRHLSPHERNITQPADLHSIVSQEYDSESSLNLSTSSIPDHDPADVFLASGALRLDTHFDQPAYPGLVNCEDNISQTLLSELSTTATSNLLKTLESLAHNEIETIGQLCSLSWAKLRTMLPISRGGGGGGDEDTFTHFIEVMTKYETEKKEERRAQEIRQSEQMPGSFDSECNFLLANMSLNYDEQSSANTAPPSEHAGVEHELHPPTAPSLQEQYQVLTATILQKGGDPANHFVDFANVFIPQIMGAVDHTIHPNFSMTFTNNAIAAILTNVLRSAGISTTTTM